ncbi:endonuclease VII domain-containing protein [Angustibacter luteus]|uniref:Endonuclease VII domain-containing protein n=1 Tax=Angustibacter luteus TaxID=658456 RepID=A0ABW1JB02_9ACTN
MNEASDERRPVVLSKLCRRCTQEKPIASFGNNASRGDGLAEYCRDCFQAINKASYRRRRAAAGKKVREARDAPDGQRWCPDCEEFRSEDAFPRHRGTVSGFGVYCKLHHNQRGRASKERLHGGSRSYHLIRRYGITAEDADLMHTRQAGLCPICLRPLGENAHVDHDHATGRVRALLCFTCNAGLGNFSDEVTRLDRAAEYLNGTLTAPSVVLPGYVDWQSRSWRRPDSVVESMIERVIHRRVGSPR